MATTEPVEPTAAEATTPVSPPPNESSTAATATDTPPATSVSSTAASERMAKFKALQARAKSSNQANLKAAAAESRHQATDMSALTSVARKHAVASHNLLKADTEAAGEDFERKRAWDWTAEESERWDRRMAKKKRHQDDVAFADFQREAAKTYKRQVREMAVDEEGYVAAKAAAVRRAAEQGGLTLVEDEDGELVLVDRDGRYVEGGGMGLIDAVGGGSEWTENKPSKEGVDRLVDNLKKAEAQRLKARKNRKGDDGPDITYINEKNKQFNMKLARFYNKYTADIRESFERGTMI